MIYFLQSGANDLFLAGNVVFADVLTTPNGRSKGCGIVEYATREEAERAIEELNNVELDGRPVFVREDRETEPKFNHKPVLRPSPSLLLRVPSSLSTTCLTLCNGASLRTSSLRSARFPELMSF